MKTALNSSLVDVVVDWLWGMTDDHRSQLNAAWYAARSTQQNEAWYAARDALTESGRQDVWLAAWDRCPDVMPCQDVILVVVTYDLATEGGRYTPDHRTVLLQPLASVYGLPEGLDGEA